LSQGQDKQALQCKAGRFSSPARRQLDVRIMPLVTAAEKERTNAPDLVSENNLVTLSRSC
jgi:hypothetical protein